MTDEQLAALCAREYPRLVSMLRLYCADEQAAQDLAQETLVRLVAHWSRVRRMESPGGWCYRVAVNLANSRWRRRTTARRVNWRLRGHADVADPPPDVAEQLTVRAALADLPDRQRQAVVLVHLMGMDVAQVADQMGCSPQAVRNLTHRARRQLREVLDHQLQEVDDVH